MDWLDLLAVQGTLKSLLPHHSSKASILQCSAFFMVQLSHPYMTTGKTTALTRWTFVGKVTSLLFNLCLGWSQLSFQGASVAHSVFSSSPAIYTLDPDLVSYAHYLAGARHTGGSDASFLNNYVKDNCSCYRGPVSSAHSRSSASGSSKSAAGGSGTL